MLRRLIVDNFKSLDDFELPRDYSDLADFTCLIGLNGAGKTSVLQFLDFLSHLMWGDVDSWLKSRNWKSNELTSQSTKRKNIAFISTFELENIGRIQWTAAFNTTLMRCTFEEIEIYGHDPYLELSSDNLSGKEIGKSKVLFEYQGSILSRLKLDAKHEVLLAVRDFVRSWKSLELLAPNLMRGKSRASTDMGSGGQDLAGFIQALSKDKRVLLLSRLVELYPQVMNIEVKKVSGGWASLEFKERAISENGVSLQVSAAHVNDGMLRVLAILAQTLTDHRILLFDEIENGINPELIGKVMAILQNLPDKQVIVTTHSPLILNYIPDEQATDAVQLLYREPNGGTRAANFFKLPGPKSKLGILGPGEVFLDTYLDDAVQQALAQVPDAVRP